MTRFQLAVVLLLAVIAGELGVIALRLPLPSAFAQTRVPIPVVINDGSAASEGCVTLASCARISNGALIVQPR